MVRHLLTLALFLALCSTATAQSDPKGIGRDLLEESEDTFDQSFEGDSQQKKTTGGNSCAKGSQIEPPQIVISFAGARIGGSWGAFQVIGTVSGRCITQTGLYEFGVIRKRLRFPLSSHPTFEKFSFDVRPGKGAEIRAKQTNGHEEVVSVDEYLVGKNPLTIPGELRR